MDRGVLNPERVLSGRTFRRIARTTEFLSTVTSTNDHIWTEAVHGGHDGHTVFAEYQTSGRGRLGRSWESPRGAAVMCSVLLVDSDEDRVPEGGVLCIVAGIAAATAIRDVTGLAALIEWPNDVVIQDRKVAGILVESRLIDYGRRSYVVGVGINCLQNRNHFPPDLRRRATSLDMECDQPIDRESVAGALLASLDEWLADPDRWAPENVCEEFRRYSHSTGRRITLYHNGETYSGEVVDIDPAAALVVMLDDGTRSVFPAAGTTVVHG